MSTAPGRERLARTILAVATAAVCAAGSPTSAPHDVAAPSAGLASPTSAPHGMATPSAGLAMRAGAGPARPAGRAAPVPGCRSADGDERPAPRLAREIRAALLGRAGRFGIEVEDRRLGVACWLNAAAHFDAASTIKPIILAALLRARQQRRQGLTAGERRLAWLMITRSDNDAATALWDDVGMRRLQRFLDVAGMRQTRLNHHGYWGLSQVTAHDDTILLTLLETRNRVLTDASRRYELRLMADVVAGQRWGVPAGAPADVTTHVKDGWLPIPPAGRWVINSLGAFTGPGRAYSIVMLTRSNPSMAYGIRTVENVAVRVHRFLNPGQPAATPRSVPAPGWGHPDEPIPQRP